MNQLFAICAFTIPLGVSIFSFPDAAVAYLFCLPFLIVAVLSIKRVSDDSEFLVKLFVAAFLLRTIVATLIPAFDLQLFFGEDAIAHEFHGIQLLKYWGGAIPFPVQLNDWNRPWGLHLLIASVYSITGRNPLVISYISSMLGSLTAIFIYLCTIRIFNNKYAGRAAALMVAFFPAMIIWSSQILKDGFVVFFVVLAIYSLIQLQEKFDWRFFCVLAFALVAVFSIRFYIFYFAVFATVCTFLFGSKGVVVNNIRWLLILGIVAIIAAYSGVLTVGREQVERMSNLESIQHSRSALSREAASGYGGDTDIRTASGAAIALPVGLANLIMAPFPWQFSSIRSLLTLPEMIVWWALIPALIIGGKFTFHNKFRPAIPVILFTVTLTAAYALFQTNVGTAYRQRTQIQVFLFVFMAAGLTVLKERREDARLLAMNRIRRFERALINRD